jgi:hypothetical protein
MVGCDSAPVCLEKCYANGCIPLCKNFDGCTHTVISFCLNLYHSGGLGNLFRSLLSISFELELDTSSCDAASVTSYIGRARASKEAELAKQNLIASVGSLPFQVPWTAVMTRHDRPAGSWGLFCNPPRST